MISLSAAVGMTTPSPRPSLPTIPPPLYEPGRPAGTTDTKAANGACCGCAEELLKFADEARDAKAHRRTFRLFLATAVVLVFVILRVLRL